MLDALVTARDVTSTTGIDYLYVIRRENNSQRQPAPTTKPANTSDPLAPRSDATPVGMKKVVMLQTSAGPGSTDTAAGTRPTGDTSGRIMIIDGKPVNAGDAAATGTATGAAPRTTDVSTDTATTGATATGTAETDTRSGFEFNSPSDQGTTRVIRIPVPELKNGDLKYNIIIKPQDMIVVPQPIQGEYYMDGHVARTGAYTLTARKIDLQQAIAAAGGYDQTAIPARTEIIRRIGADQKVFAMFDLDKISAGQQPDIYLKPNDVVRVGTNVFAPFISAARNAFRLTYGFGFLYDRNFGPDDNNNN